MPCVCPCIVKLITLTNMDNSLDVSTAKLSGGAGIERAALALVGAVSIAAVAGYATFGVHPELLRGQPSAQLVYAVAFTLFARGQIIVAALALCVFLVRRVRFIWLPAALAVYAVSLGTELAGTMLGVPFGAYAYTEGLGTKWFGHVP